MFRLSKSKREKGFTLIEILVVIVILAVVMVAITSITVQSISKYNAISAEIHLRDEADLVMSQVYSSIYKLKESQICDATSFTTKQSMKYSTTAPVNCTTLSATRELGYTGSESFNLYGTQTYKISNKNITVTNFSITRKGAGRYEINLELKMKNKNISRKFNNEVLTINDVNL
jgi:prepilin-type N-terminal cleavage/methylation domain-containing protein